MKWLGKWYHGRWTQPYNPPNGLVIIGGHFEYHWTARIARAVVSFYLKNWQWVWGTVIALAALWVSVLSLKAYASCIASRFSAR